MTGEESSCLQCTAVFTKKTRWHRCCSKNCNQNYKRNSKRDKKCSVCDTEFFDNTERNRRKYCSTRCKWDRDCCKQYNLDLELYLKWVTDPIICHLCDKVIEQRKDAHVDHCHSSKKVRGLLCHNCNVGLGNLKHNEKVLKKAILYLKGDL